MRAFSKVIIGIGVMLASLIVVLVFLNVGDQQLDPEIKNIQEASYSVETQNLKAYHLRLGILAPPQQDASARGLEIYKAAQELMQRPEGKKLVRPREEALKVDSYVGLVVRNLDGCSPKAYEENKKEVDQWLQKNHVVLKRLDKLLESPKMASDLNPSLVTPMVIGLEFLRFKELYELRACHLIRSGKPQVAFAQILKMAKFVENTMKATPTLSLLDIMIGVAVYRGAQNFVVATLAENSELKPVLTESVQERWAFDLRYEDLIHKARTAELAMMAELIQKPFDIRDYQLSALPGDKKEDRFYEQWVLPTISATVGLFFRPHHTLNELKADWDKKASLACVQNPVDCHEQLSKTKFGNYIVNPVGVFLVRSLFLTSVQSRFKKLYDWIEKIKTAPEKV